MLELLTFIFTTLSIRSQYWCKKLGINRMGFSRLRVEHTEEELQQSEDIEAKLLVLNRTAEQIQLKEPQQGNAADCLDDHELKIRTRHFYRGTFIWKSLSSWFYIFQLSYALFSTFLRSLVSTIPEVLGITISASMDS